MIYVVTIHWRTPKWIDPQLDYLKRHINAPFRVFATLNDLKERSMWERFDYADDRRGHHGLKLNALAQRVTDEADPSDILIFLDSDAFPIRPLDHWLEANLAHHPLIAVQRRENFGDLRPHPSFCATTVAYWDRIGGDWSREPWTTPLGEVLEDAGTRVLRSLDEARAEWLPLVRTNTREVHPLFFGVYGHYVYHHGAGSRASWSGHDDQRVFTDSVPTDQSLRTLASEVTKDPRLLLRVRPKHRDVLMGAVARSVSQVRMRLIVRSTKRKSHRVFRRLSRDPSFYLDFDDAAIGGV
ncbi:MAG TPA: hypothetical protein VG032_13075 [Acidimicrobiales bacterium]|jgi:hypothetical protein|nr:hypothetical protein [Acidimicrobiales bacterium]